jgi:hypothetical protein
MSTGDTFYYLGSNGAYQASAANQQNLVMNAGMLGAASYGGFLAGGNIWTQGTTQTVGIGTQYVTATTTLSDYVAKAQEPAKQAKRKIKGLLANLRAEIDGWHADVLERCPA